MSIDPEELRDQTQVEIDTKTLCGGVGIEGVDNNYINARHLWRYYILI